MDFEDFGYFGDPDLMEPMERYSDDLMDFRDKELDEDEAAGEYEPESTMMEDDCFETGLGLE